MAPRETSDFFRLLLILGVCSACVVATGDDGGAPGEPWIKRKQISDRFLVGMVKGRNTLCKGGRNGAEIEGVCVSPRECTAMGGVRGGPCSLLGTCCIVEKTCSEVTRARLSYFVSGQSPSPVCQLRVKPVNSDVCEIRLDFEKFSLAKPTQPKNSETGAFECFDDAFSVLPHRKSLGFSALCGENSGQHVYVPIGDENEIILNFNLQDEKDKLDPKKRAHWRIRIRQLECGSPRQLLQNITHSHLELLYNQANKLKQQPSEPNDFDLLAPPGCLQYFPKPEGTYESFNFDGAKGCYIGKMSYAICFNKSPNVYGVRHQAEYLKMSKNMNSALDTECHPKEMSPTVSQDYLYMPGVMMDDQHVEYFCGDMLQNPNSVTAKASGPLYVAVNTDEAAIDANAEKGFRFQYRLLVAENTQ